MAHIAISYINFATKSLFQADLLKFLCELAIIVQIVSVLLYYVFK